MLTTKPLKFTVPSVAMAAFEEHKDMMIEEWQYTYDEVLDCLALEGPGTMKRTLREFCVRKGIGRTAHRVSEADLHTTISSAINQVSSKTLVFQMVMLVC